MACCFTPTRLWASKDNEEIQINLLDDQNVRKRKLKERRTARDKISLLSKYSQVVFGTDAPSALAFVSSRVFCARASNSALSTRLPRIGSKAVWSSLFATSISRSGEPGGSSESLGGGTGLEDGNERDAREQGEGFDVSHDCYAFVIPLSSTSAIMHQPSMSSDEKTPDQPNKSSSLESDISTLASLIATTKITANGDKTNDPETVEGVETEELGMEEVEELMRRLEAANGIAEGVEDKLDGILEHLDGLLNSLEASGERKENGGPTDPQPDR